MKTMMCGLLVPILLATPAWSAEIFGLEWIEEVPATDAAELYDRAPTCNHGEQRICVTTNPPQNTRGISSCIRHHSDHPPS